MNPFRLAFYALFAFIKGNSYDDFLLVRQWSPDLQRHSLHGLWTERFDGTYPSFCRRLPMSPADLAPLEPRLHQRWPSKFGDDYSFHMHEFEKHASCIVPTPTPLEFFNNTLNLDERYDLNEAFADVPAGSCASLAGLLKRTRDVGLEGSVVKCRRHSAASCEVTEVWSCLDKAMRPMACRGVRGDARPGDCLWWAGPEGDVPRAHGRRRRTSLD